MLTWLSKYVCIFYLFTLLSLIVLFYNTKFLEFNCTLGLCNIQSEGTTPLERKQTFCSHLGKEPSAEEALEQRYLLESNAWPEPLYWPTPTPIEKTSDPALSLFAILPVEGGRERQVGDQLEARVIMNDYKGRPKRYGGDFLLVRLHSPQLGAAVAGQVLDHKNGSYSAFFPLLWEGPVQAEVTLVHPSEAISVLRRLREERPDRVLYKSVFRSGLLSETTMCNLCLPASEQPVCNYTDTLTGEPWYCYKPKQNLSCDKRINHFRAGYQNDLLTRQEALLFQSGVNIKVRIPATGLDSVTVLPTNKDKPGAEGITVLDIPGRPTPSGYYYQWLWQGLGGVVIREYKDPAAITQCLKGKVVYMYGDSTVRQYYEFLTSFLPEMKEFNLRSPAQAGPFMAVDVGNNIMQKYRSHGPPISYLPLSITQLRHVANELDGLVGGSDTVVIISLWAHFTTFPLEVYIRRIRHIRGAVVRLLDRAPETLVVVCSPNLRGQNLEESPVVSDWFAVQLNGVLRAMFKGVKVLLLDAWDMTLAHYLPHDVHPPPPIIKNMINIILSHLCPEKN